MRLAGRQYLRRVLPISRCCRYCDWPARALAPVSGGV